MPDFDDDDECEFCKRLDHGLPVNCIVCGKKCGHMNFMAMDGNLYHLFCYRKEIKVKHITTKNGVVPCYKCKVPLEEFIGDIIILAHHPFCVDCAEVVMDEG